MDMKGRAGVPGIKVHLQGLWNFHSTRVDVVSRELALIYITEGH
jgi:hypothetical protein